MRICSQRNWTSEIIRWLNGCYFALITGGTVPLALPMTNPKLWWLTSHHLVNQIESILRLSKQNMRQRVAQMHLSRLKDNNLFINHNLLVLCTNHRRREGTTTLPQLGRSELRNLRSRSERCPLISNRSTRSVQTRRPQAQTRNKGRPLQNNS